MFLVVGVHRFDSPKAGVTPKLILTILPGASLTRREGLFFSMMCLLGASAYPGRLLRSSVALRYPLSTLAREYSPLASVTIRLPSSM